MGKATELDERLSRQFLTPAQVAARKAATEISDDDVVATLDGTLVKQVPSAAPREVVRAPQQTWD